MAGRESRASEDGGLGRVEELIRRAEHAETPGERQMLLLEAEVWLEREQAGHLRTLTTISRALERDSRWLVALSIVLLVEAISEAAIFLMFK